MQRVLYGIGAAIALLIVIGLALPRHINVTVSTQIEAHPATVFALVNDFHRMALWSPWFDTDPNVRIIYSGPDRGVDATMTWDGMIIGSGMQMITESRPFEHVASVINPGEPSQVRTWFDVKGGDGTTTITWGFEADQGFNLVGRYFARMLGNIVRRDYDKGLASLAELAESLPATDFSDAEIEHLVVEASEIAYLAAAATPEPAAISEALGAAYFEILNFMDKQHLQPAGAPLSITHSFSGAEMLFDAAIPVRGVSDSTPRDGTNVKLRLSYAGPVIRVRHVGSYRALGTTHKKIAAYMAALGIKRNGSAWESYVSDPAKVSEDKLVTYVYFPVRQ